MCMHKKVNQPFIELERGMFYWKTKPVCFGCAATHRHGSWLGYSVLEVLWQYVGVGTYWFHAKIIH